MNRIRMNHQSSRLHLVRPSWSIGNSVSRYRLAVSLHTEDRTRHHARRRPPIGLWLDMCGLSDLSDIDPARHCNVLLTLALPGTLHSSSLAIRLIVKHLRKKKSSRFADRFSLVFCSLPRYICGSNKSHLQAEHWY
jgi:hypothetical protein